MAFTAPPLIRMSGLSRVFLTDEIETHALSEIDLEIARGEFVSIAGPSGCGKSTLLAIAGLLDSPTAGEYVLKDQHVEKLSLRERCVATLLLACDRDTDPARRFAPGVSRAGTAGHARRSDGGSQT